MTAAEEGDAKRRYRETADRIFLPIFQQPWWLDAVATPGGWETVVVSRGGEVRAGLPFIVRRRGVWTTLVMPPLTPFLGPWFVDEPLRQSTRLAKEKEFTAEMIAALPAHHVFSQCLRPEIANWLPWYWAGFSQTTRYTYVIDDLTDADGLWSRLDDTVRNDIRKARARYNLHVRDDISVEQFLAVNRLSFVRQGKAVPYDDDLVRRIDENCAGRMCRRMIAAVDDRGRHHAVAYFVWDAERTYYLMGGADPELRASGATSLLLWDAIVHAASVSRRLDFEGSMMEGVERLYRRFGARQEPYHSVWKHNGLGGWIYGLMVTAKRGRLRVAASARRELSRSKAG
jgi:hypothetical protein